MLGQYMEIDGKKENDWKWMEMNGNERKWLETNRKMEMNGNNWKQMEINGTRSGGNR